MPSKYKLFDREKLNLLPLADRAHDMEISDLLELHQATGDSDTLRLARRIADNILRMQKKTGLFARPVEWGWNREEFLQHTCNKAGLPNDSWKDEDSQLFWFSAIVFGEK